MLESDLGMYGQAMPDPPEPGDGYESERLDGYSELPDGSFRAIVIIAVACVVCAIVLTAIGFAISLLF